MTPAALGAYFGTDPAEVDLSLSYNVAPTNDIYGVISTSQGHRRLEVFRWGLVPSWADSLQVGARLINARAETLADKPSFRTHFRRHRCLVPMSGFYEWTTVPGPAPRARAVKQPWLIERADGRPLAAAGLWSAWRDRQGPPDAPWVHTCTVITTAANATMAEIHDRMPALLEPETWDHWLDPELHDTEELQHLLVPAPDGLLVMREVSRQVNNVANRGPF
jgi:putative SOS response-associated peptidase YedK